jgi:hypothetical protein
MNASSYRNSDVRLEAPGASNRPQRKSELREMREMPEQIVQEIINVEGTRRVIVVRRSDGRFTYRQQAKGVSGWGPATIDAGVYDSAETAESEARQRVKWLKAMFH